MATAPRGQEKRAMATALRGHDSHNTPYNQDMPTNPAHPARRHRVRHDIPGHARLLTFSCYGRQPLIDQLHAWSLVTNAIGRARDKHRFKLLAYVVMPEHIHLMILPLHDNPAVSGILTTIKQSSAKLAITLAHRTHPNLLNSMTDTQPNGRSSVRLWQRGGGHDRNLYKPETIWDAVEYLHGNPVHRSLATTADDWRWSSAAAYRHGATEPLQVDLDTMPAFVRIR
jgi:putative transposase